MDLSPTEVVDLASIALNSEVTKGLVPAQVEYVKESVVEINEELSENNINKILCVENKGYSRKTFYLWFKGEAVSKISVAGNGEACFEIGQYENEWQWKASKGPNGMKKSFYSGVATFY